MFFQPITNLVWNRRRSAQNNSRSQVTFSARKIPSTLVEGGVGGGGGWGWRRCFKHFLEYTYFSRLVRWLLGYNNHFYVFSFIRIYLFIFFNLLNFYPVTRFLFTSLLVTGYSLLVTVLLCLVTPPVAPGMTISVYALHCCVCSDPVTVSFFNRNFIEGILRISLVGIVPGNKFYLVLPCRSGFPVLIVNLSILKHFNNKDFS